MSNARKTSNEGRVLHRVLGFEKTIVVKYRKGSEKSTAFVRPRRRETSVALMLPWE
jgi:hypothetical protein